VTGEGLDRVARARFGREAERRALVRPLEADPDLMRALGPAEAAAARRAVVTDAAVVRGAETLAALLDEVRRGDTLGLLLLDGLLLRRTTAAGEATVEPLGTGDVLAGELAPGGALVGTVDSWEVCQAARVAILDAGFAHAVGRWPPLLAEVLRRATRRAETLALLRGITRLRQLEVRVLVLLWHLAERWGRVGPDGVVLPLPLTQQMLAELISARRPSVNAALRELAAAGHVAYRRRAGWVLYGEPPAVARAGDVTRMTPQGGRESAA
jgi:CRP/FNR family cyclic AMP-dependent transcriptional regulator